MSVLDRDTITVARQVVITVGGRYSTELGIDVDGGEAEVERWFMAATLFGTRISAAVAGRTFRVLDDAGLTRIAHARHVPWDERVPPSISAFSTPTTGRMRSETWPDSPAPAISIFVTSRAGWSGSHSPTTAPWTSAPAARHASSART